MENIRSLSHTKWECKYHIVWIPKYRKKTLYGRVRQYLEALLKESAVQKRMYHYRGALVGGSYPYLDLNPPQIRRSPSCGLSQGEECDPYCPGLSGAEKKLCW
jgi:putative transposase